MLVVMSSRATPEEVGVLIGALRERGLEGRLIDGAAPPVVLVLDELGAVAGSGGLPAPDLIGLESLPGVDRVERRPVGPRLVSRSLHPESTTIRIGAVAGARAAPLALGAGLVIMAGPCAVESLDQMREIAAAVKSAGCQMLRGGAFKPRTSPYAFQGLGEEGLAILARVAREFELPIITECMDAADLTAVSEVADIVQIGARNMQNFTLLRAAGACAKPIMLKRGFAATAEEMLLAAEHIMVAGNPNVIFCERGLRTFADHSRFTLDLAVVPHLKEVSHLPVVVDPSHGTGRRKLIPAMARAAAAVAPDGIMLEVHPDPERALSDGHQALSFEQLHALVGTLRAIHQLASGATPAPLDLQAVEG